MAAGSNASLHVPQFSGENYQIWTVKMKSYLKAFGLWEYVAEDKQFPPSRANPTIAQMKQHEEEKMKKDKAVTCLHSALSDSVFTSIMHLETSKSIWDELKSRFKQSQQIQQPMEQEIQQPMQQANYTDDHVCDEHLFTMSQACMATSTKTWYIDSGCTSHMARDEGMFTTLDRSATTTVKLGNDHC
ncbi:hypothetical protein LWI29_036602 [Acer saccharum]|uniref:Retrovirus-related Pol polyprotein from transposon TNT 1-94-like beta-barrel domain-containing protein n=1 Tax=Acer saccharum TaxID=4024 RepID=A0AA39RK43_ACESA|nr:hypothetical protein LWI29_036602 [Acer saccharum]